MKKFYALLIGLIAPAVLFAGPVDINSADAQTIADELDGVGLVRAQAIVEYRNQHGAFGSADEVLNVKGIGPQILDANRGNILTGDGDG